MRVQHVSDPRIAISEGIVAKVVNDFFCMRLIAIDDKLRATTRPEHVFGEYAIDVSA